MDIEHARKHYATLSARWTEVHIEAVEANAVCIAKFRAGEGPTMEELDKAQALQQLDEQLRGEMDEFVGCYFAD